MGAEGCPGCSGCNHFPSRTEDKWGQVCTRGAEGGMGTCAWGGGILDYGGF